MILCTICATTLYDVIGGRTISCIIFATSFYGVIGGHTISYIIFATIFMVKSKGTQYHT
jgi:hypothetical protein